jgi:ribosomal-protein-alanine N-acetyltransferase
VEKARPDLRRAPDGRDPPLVRGLRGEHVIELIPGYHVFTLEEASLEGLNRLMRLEEDIFGEETLDEWYMVSHIHHGNVLVLLDAAKRKTVGIAILMRDWDELDKCYLADFGIREDYRGKGLGSSFLRKVLELVREEGFSRISLTVDTANEPAIGLYRKHGFRIVQERRHLYGEGRHRYVMELNVMEINENHRELE